MRQSITLRAICALAAGAWLGMAGAASAEGPPPDYTRNGWYLQAQGVFAWQNFQDFETGDDAGFNVLGGWRGWQLFAGELEFEWTNRFQGKGGDPDFRIYDIALLFKVYPLARLFDPSSIGNRFQPWLKTGPGWQWVERRGGGLPNRDRGGFAGRVGGGMDFYVTENWVLVTSANYQLPSSDVDRFQYLTVGGGIQYRFGGRGS